MDTALGAAESLRELGDAEGMELLNAYFGQLESRAPLSADERALADFFLQAPVAR